MFERYTETARQIIFFALFEARQRGSAAIQTEHLLLALLERDKALAERFVGTAHSESIREQVAARLPRRVELPAAHGDLPLSHECKRVLAYGAEEAERLKHKHIGTEHLLLGLLREENGPVAVILREEGVKLARIRERLVAGTEASAERLRNEMAACLGAQESECGITVLVAPKVGSRCPDIGVYIGEWRESAPDAPPFICIDILTPHLLVSQLFERIDEDLAFGVRYIWLLDAGACRAYVATAETGLHEFRDSVLKTENPTVELPLDQVFL
jgi:hypothetical protein